MTSFGSCYNFQRLEDFPSYSSVIRSFGKSIIPPLLTPQRRAEISKLRALVLQKNNIMKNSQKLSMFYEQYEDSNGTNTEQVFSQRGKEKVNQKISALNSANLKKFNVTPSANAMHVSMSKIPCNGVCSTVHDCVIVCPNEIKQNHDDNCAAELEGGDSNSEYCESYSEKICDCQACQIKYTDVPYKNELSEHMHSVSEDEQESVIGEAEFESLPTVINRKTAAQDTDSESIITSVTQSTDLEKYMDASIEFSSPDDSATILQSQSSNQLSLSSRSDDASTETIVNTENELTPCASAMALLCDFSEGASPDAPASEPFLANMCTVNANKRAYSVDSYMKILRNCARELYLKKSQSEPSRPIANQPLPQGTFLGSEDSSAEINTLTNNDRLVPPSLRNELEQVQVFKDSKRYSDPELEPKRNYIRRNSYTLLYPSSALIRAHAECQCQYDSSVETDPHSCSSHHENPSFSSAFKKETIEFDLPPTPDRERMFPVLNCDSSQQNQPEIPDSTITTGIENDNSDCGFSRPSSISDSIPSSIPEDLNVNLDEHFPDVEEELLAPESREVYQKSQNLGNLPENSSMKETNLKRNNNDNFLAKLFEELKESHQLRVNQLIEEQNKQWLKLQEDFAQQERILVENIKSSGISTCLGDNSIESSSITNTDFQVNEEISTCAIHPDELTSSDSNSTNLSSGTDTYPTIIQNHVRSKDKHEQEEVVQSTELYGPFNLVNASNVEHSEKLCSSKLIPTEACHSHTNVQDGAQQSEPEHAVCPVVTSTKSVPITALIRNDTGYPDACKQNVAVSNSAHDSISTVKVVSEGLPPTHSHNLTSSNINHKGSTSFCSETKTCNFSKDNKITGSTPPPKKVDPLQTSTCVINKKNKVTASHFVPSCDKDIKKNYVIHSTSASRNCDLKSSVSRISECRVNLNEPGPSGTLNQSQNAPRSKCLPHKSFTLPSIPAKAIKMASSTMAISKRGSNKNLNDPDMLKRFEKLPAFVKGYLTRRLLKTERIQNMIKTMQETARLMQNLSDELTFKGSSISERDMELYNGLLKQLLTVFAEVHNILCIVSTKERMKIIAESRNLRRKKLMAEKQQEESSSSLIAERPNSHPAPKNKLSSVTLKSLQRKKRSSIDNRTYTIEDLKGARSHSCSSQKTVTTSPHRIYQASVGVNLNRKTKSFVKPTHTQHWK